MARVTKYYFGLCTDIFWLSKVEKILKGSLGLIQSPSPSVKIQITGRIVCLRCNGKTLLGVDITQQCFALLPQVNFPTNNLNFHCDGIEPRLFIISELGGVI